MIIDDEYCQYEMWRIVNKAETDAIADFTKLLEEAEAATDPASVISEAANKWSEKAAALKAAADASEETTEESVYDVNYSGKMDELLKKHLNEISG